MVAITIDIAGHDLTGHSALSSSEDEHKVYANHKAVMQTTGLFHRAVRRLLFCIYKCVQSVRVTAQPLRQSQ